MATEEKPILFSGEMVKAILEGRKTQTRRVVKLIDFCVLNENRYSFRDKKTYIWSDMPIERLIEKHCPYGKPGDLLWVRETTWRNGGYVATDKPNIKNEGKVPSIFMPKWLTRIWLKMLSVRVERLQELKPIECVAEGSYIPKHGYTKIEGPLAISAFADSWDFLNKKHGYDWETNPWVWVIEFERMKDVRSTG